MTRVCAGAGRCNAIRRVRHSSSNRARCTASTDQPIRAAISFSATPLSASRRMAPRWTSIGSARKCQCNGGVTRDAFTDHCCVSIDRPQLFVPVPCALAGGQGLLRRGHGLSRLSTPAFTHTSSARPSRVMILGSPLVELCVTEHGPDSKCDDESAHDHGIVCCVFVIGEADYPRRP